MSNPATKAALDRRRYLDQVIPELVGLVADVPGDLIEFGVLSGDSLVAIAHAAHGRRVHAVDSFEGMAEPTEEDGEIGKLCYPKGRFSRKGSTSLLQDRLVRDGVGGAVLLWRGFVPGVLESLGQSVASLSFAHVDLDHYGPTKHALAWVWDRLSPGGVVLMHDWFPTRAIYMASRAIRDFRRRHDGDLALVEEDAGGWMWVRRR